MPNAIVCNYGDRILLTRAFSFSSAAFTSNAGDSTSNYYLQPLNPPPKINTNNGYLLRSVVTYSSFDCVQNYSRLRIAFFSTDFNICLFFLVTQICTVQQSCDQAESSTRRSLLKFRQRPEGAWPSSGSPGQLQTGCSSEAGLHRWIHQPRCGPSCRRRYGTGGSRLRQRFAVQSGQLNEKFHAMPFVTNQISPL